MSKSFRRLMALVLCLAMVLCLAACGSKTTDTSADTAADTSADASDASDATYTFTYATTAPSTWSPTDWQNDVENTIQGYTQTPFYSFELNETADDYEIVPAAASEMPIDVTADLTAEQKALYNVPEDATEGYAWTINLNEKLCWENGDLITADDYIYSLQQYLNSEMKNYRASTYYEGTTGLANAKGYYSAGGTLWADCIDVYAFSDLTLDSDGQYVTPNGEKVYINWSNSCAWMDGASWEEYIGYGYGVDDIADELTANLNDDGYIPLTEDSFNLLFGYTSSDEWGNETEDDFMNYCCYDGGVSNTSWDEVGCIRNGDYSLTFVLTNPTTEFYICYAMYIGLVKEDLYEANKVTTGDITKSSYGTDADKYMSYGPYKIVSYQADKEMRYTKNENWYGYSEERYADKYQTTDIYEQYITENNTILSLFLQGNLDVYTVDTEHMETYATSDYIYYTPTTYSYVFSFNTDYDALSAEDGNGVNHSILSLDSFRSAINLSLDRQAFATQCLAGSDAGYGLLNYVYIDDPDTGELYRESEYAKQAMCDLYGVDDESEITGYDKEAAAQLFQQAYDEAIASGIMSNTDRIELDYHVYADTTNNQNRVNFLQSSIDAATAGTSLEGKVTINLIVDEEYYDNCMVGLCDIAFTAWGGEDMNPYAMMQCYTDPTLNLVYGYDATAEDITINVNGEDITMDAYDWYLELCEGEWATADTDTRNQILAGMEEGILAYHGMATLAYLNDAELYSQRIVPGADHYINSLVGWGGLESYTYTMNDSEWAEYCAGQNNQLTY